MSLPRARDLYTEMVLHGVDVATVTHFVASYQMILRETVATRADVKSALASTIAKVLSGSNDTSSDLLGAALTTRTASVDVFGDKDGDDDRLVSDFVVRLKMHKPAYLEGIEYLDYSSSKADDPLIGMVVAGGDLDNLPDPRCVKSRLPQDRAPTRDDVERAIAECLKKVT